MLLYGILHCDQWHCLYIVADVNSTTTNTLKQGIVLTLVRAGCHVMRRAWVRISPSRRLLWTLSRSFTHNCSAPSIVWWSVYFKAIRGRSYIKYGWAVLYCTVFYCIILEAVADPGDQSDHGPPNHFAYGLWPPTMKNKIGLSIPIWSSIGLQIAVVNSRPNSNIYLGLHSLKLRNNWWMVTKAMKD